LAAAMAASARRERGWAAAPPRPHSSKILAWATCIANVLGTGPAGASAKGLLSGSPLELLMARCRRALGHVLKHTRLHVGHRMLEANKYRRLAGFVGYLGYLHVTGVSTLTAGLTEHHTGRVGVLATLPWV